SRYSMLAGDTETAVRIGREALAIAETLGLDDVRAHALNNIGAARCSAGDLGGIADLERSIEIGTTGDSHGDLARAYNNLATIYGEHVGDVRRDLELRREAVRVAESVGNQRLARYAGAVLLFDNFYAGRWDDFIRKAERYLEESERLGGGYQDAFFRATLAFIALARGEDAHALAGARQALALAGKARDPPVLLAVLGDVAGVHL